MGLFKITSWKDILIHVAIIIALTAIFIYIFFYVYLPSSTNQGETITVPDLRGRTLSELNDVLGSHLRYEVIPDSGYSASLPPLTVLTQFPPQNSRVKENRKIYLTVNAKNPPLVKMPKLEGGSVKNAQLVLKTYGLELGEIKYVPDMALNYILEQKVDGRPISPGEKVAKGSKIGLVVGDGLGRQTLRSPDLINLDEESARFAIIGSGLKVGDVKYEKEGTAVRKKKQPDGSTLESKLSVSPGGVYKQNPDVGDEMRLGQKVNIWIYKPDSVSTRPTLLNEE